MKVFPLMYLRYFIDYQLRGKLKIPSCICKNVQNLQRLLGMAVKLSEIVSKLYNFSVPNQNGETAPRISPFCQIVQ
jgi:hypothetical protein